MITFWGRNVTFHFYPALQAFYIGNCVTLLISILAGYLLLYKTPLEMKQYKYVLLNLWFWTAGSDFLITMVIEPQLFFPLMGGTSASIVMNYTLPVLHDSGYGSWLFLWFFLVNGSLSLLDGFLYRLWALSINSWVMHDPRRIIMVYLLIHSINVVPELILGILAYTPRNETEIYILKEYPSYASVLTLANYVIIEPRLNAFNTYFYYSQLIGIVWIFTTVGWVMSKIYWELKKFRVTMSERTYQQHKMLILTLVVQLAIPLFIFYIPILLGIAYLFLLADDKNSSTVTVVAHIFLVLFCFHTNLNIISMILLITPYRVEVRRLLGVLRLMPMPTNGSSNRISNVPTSSF